MQELDLQRFIKRQRVALIAILGLLKDHQARIVDKVSELVLETANPS